MTNNYNSTDQALILCLQDMKEFMTFGLSAYTSCNMCEIKSISIILISSPEDLGLTTYCSKRCSLAFAKQYVNDSIYEMISCKSYEDIENKQQEIINACEKLKKIGLLL